MTANNMQRVFETLQASPKMLSHSDLSAALNFTIDAVKNALRGLRRHRCIRSAFDGTAWLYGLRDGARCPDGNKGRKRAAG